MAIDWTKPIETEDGLKARVLATDLKRLTPFVVAIEIDGEEFIFLYHADGTAPFGGDKLRNVTEKKNEAADKYSGINRVEWEE